MCGLTVKDARTKSRLVGMHAGPYNRSNVSQSGVRELWNTRGKSLSSDWRTNRVDRSRIACSEYELFQVAKLCHETRYSATPGLKPSLNASRHGGSWAKPLLRAHRLYADKLAIDIRAMRWRRGRRRNLEEGYTS